MNEMDLARHDRLRTVTRVWLLIVAVLPATSGGGAAARAGGDPAQPTQHRKYLLLDSRVVDRTKDAVLVLGEVRKHPANPLFVEDKPWEVRFDNLYANVLYDQQKRVYKCWYNPFIICEVTTNTPPEKRKTTPYRPRRREMAICNARSKDGISWEKPDLGVVEFEGSRANNIVLRNIHGAGVHRDDHDADPSRRYKVFASGGVAFSPDGVRWSAFRPCPGIKAAGDTHNNAFWDERSRRYVGITRLWNDGQRIVGRTEGQDFVRWTAAVEVLRGTRDRQTYAMPVFAYAGVYLGLVMILDGKTDCVDCELAWSPDTVHWERICEGCPLIPRGPKGAFDSGCIYAAADPVFAADEIRLYYGGGDDVHMSWRKTGLGLARLRPDGFAGYEPDDPDKAATIVTKPITCTGEQLRVTVDAAGGSLRVGVLEAEGFALGDCRPVTADVTDALVKWRGWADLAALRGKPVRLQFELRKAKLYAFGFGP